MKRYAGFAMLLVVSSITPAVAEQKRNYPPITDYLLDPDYEIRLAQSAAPAYVTGDAEIRLLTKDGYRKAKNGSNGFVCMVLRGFAVPTYRPKEMQDGLYDPALVGPICYDPVAVKSVLPYQEFRTKLAMSGKSADEIALAVTEAYESGVLPKQVVSFGYMFSAAQYVGHHAGAWYPHLMVYAPGYTNEMLGNATREDMPRAVEDPGTPFAVVAVPINPAFAIQVRPPRKPAH